MRISFFLLSMLFTCNLSIGQAHQHEHKSIRTIDFPDLDSVYVMVCDFHQHTVFSDGSVWPNIRVQEAIKDGLDAISLTEHLEYQPHKMDIPHPDRNRAFEIASKAAINSDLLVISGSEITRSMPPGHANAIFIKDSNQLLKEDYLAVFEEANSQGAFIFWNHPNWISQRKDGIATLTNMHLELIQKGQLHGIEVVNEDTYSDEALQIALDHNLTIMGTSDIHGLIDWQYNVPQGHRPVTLVLAKERSKNGLKKALFSGRTVVYFNNMLIGKEANLKPLIKASLKIEAAKYIGDSQVLSVDIINESDMDYMLKNKSEFRFHKNADLIEFKGNSTTQIQVKTVEIRKDLNLIFEVLNAVSSPGEHPEIVIEIDVAE